MYDCDLAFGGSAKGDRLSSVASIGEYTVVASAKRGVRGTLRDVSDDEVDVRSRAKGSGRFFWFGMDMVDKENLWKEERNCCKSAQVEDVEYPIDKAA